MPAWVQRIDTLRPDFSFSQEEAMTKMQEWARDHLERRLFRADYRNSGIDRQHSVLQNYDGEAKNAFFLRAHPGTLGDPGTAVRNDIFAVESHARRKHRCFP